MKLNLETSLQNFISQLTDDQKEKWSELNDYPFDEEEILSNPEEGLASVLEVMGTILSAKSLEEIVVPSETKTMWEGLREQVGRVSS